DAAESRRQLNQPRIRSKRVASWRTFLTTFRAKNGESVGSGTRPRISHNCLSSSRSIVSNQLNYLQSWKLRSNGKHILQTGSFKKAFELTYASRMPHFTQGLRFDLANTLASDLKLPAYFFQGPAISIDQPKSLLQHLPFAVGERLKHVLDFFLQQNDRSHVARIFGAPVFDEIAKIRFLALAHRRLQPDGLRSHLEDRPQLIYRQADFFGRFVGRGFAPVFLHELFLHTHELVNRLDHVDRDANRAGLVSNRASNGLSNPPCRISGKLV